MSSATPIIVRPLASDAEYTTYFAMADRAFSDEPSVASAERWRDVILSMPGCRPELVRGAFRGDAQVGGYLLYERMMHVGTAQALTGCVGAVVTDAAQRKQGVARVLMQDCIAYARSQHYAFLLLDGIPDFYYRFGYADVFDVAAHEINLAAILAQPASDHTVRPATMDDAAAILTLYQQTYGSERGEMTGWYNGSFVRTLERQQHALQRRDADNPLLLAVDASGQAEGYLSLNSSELTEAGEVVANDWSSLLALVQHHAQRVAGPTAPAALRYRLPPDSPLLDWLITHLEVPDKPTGFAIQPSEIWSVRSQTYHHRHAGWQARIIDVPALAQALFPAWQARWNAALANWDGDITFAVEDAIFVLHFAGERLQLRPDAAPTGERVQVTQQALTQLVFGYRPVSWFASQPDQEIPPSTHAILNILFPLGHTWIPRSDWF